jgi:hypothetical protein
LAPNAENYLTQRHQVFVTRYGYFLFSPATVAVNIRSAAWISRMAGFRVLLQIAGAGFDELSRVASCRNFLRAQLLKQVLNKITPNCSFQT